MSHVLVFPDVNLEQQNLRELNRSCVFKPSTPDGRDEIIIPDMEVLRLRSLGELWDSPPVRCLSAQHVTFSRKADGMMVKKLV